MEFLARNYECILLDYRFIKAIWGPVKSQIWTGRMKKDVIH